MKEIFLSTALVSLLFLTGCDDSSTKTPALGTSSIDDENSFITQIVKPINIVEGHKKIASFSGSSSNMYSIVAGDTLYFEIIDNALYFKNPQSFLEGGNNQYKVEVLATKSNAKATKLIFTINIIKALSSGQIVVTDRLAPIINPTVNAAVDTDIVLATDNVAVTALTLTGTDATHFVVNGTTVRTPATAGTYHIGVTAKDFANNTTTQNVTVTVTNVAQTGTLIWSPVEDNRYTWDQANSACQAMANGPWRLPTISELRAYSDTLHAQLPASAKGSVIWSADDATPEANGTKRRFGWGYFDTPADESAQPVSQPYYFTCVKSH